MSKVGNKDLEILTDKIRKIKAEIQDKYHIEELGLFGSYVRGEQTENSDIDLLVTFKPEARFGLFTYCNLQNLLSDKLGKKVDLVMKNSLKSHIIKYILNEVIYL